MLRSTYFADPLSPDPSVHAQINLHTFHGGYRLHWQTFFELEFVVSGECIHLLNGEPHPFQKGDICFLNPASIHQFIPSGNTPATIYTLSFEASILPADVWSYLPIENLPSSLHLSDEEFIAVKHIFDSLHAQKTPNGLPIDTVSLAGIEWLLLNVFRSPKQDTDKNMSKIQPAIVYIQNNFSEPIRLKDAAAVVHFSPEYFSELFRKATGKTFQQYLLELRLYFASKLLHVPDLSISEISDMSGFQSPAYFSNAFMAYHGMRPSEFRKQGMPPFWFSYKK